MYVGLAEVGVGVADFGFLTGEALVVGSSVDEDVGELHAATAIRSPAPQSAIALPRTIRGPRRSEPVMFVSVPYICGHSGQPFARVLPGFICAELAQLSTWLSRNGRKRAATAVN